MESLEKIYLERLGPTWYEILESYILSVDFAKVRDAITQSMQQTAVYPVPTLAFEAFRLCPYDTTKVVIIGQDPYHNGTANGLAFSANKLNPSLRNIIAAIEAEYGSYFWRSYDLTDLAVQGVLLLNTALTVERGKPGSHLHLWRDFTKIVVTALKQKEHLVWMAWGKYAKTIIGEVPPNHLLLEAIHPAATVYNHDLNFEPQFKRCDEYLFNLNMSAIQWQNETDLPF